MLLAIIPYAVKANIKDHGLGIGIWYRVKIVHLLKLEQFKHGLIGDLKVQKVSDCLFF